MSFDRSLEAKSIFRAGPRGYILRRRRRRRRRRNFI